MIRKTLFVVSFVSLIHHVVCLAHKHTARDLQIPSIIAMELYNGETDSKIVDITNGMEIGIGSIPGLHSPNFNINAIASGPVSSIVFGYNEKAIFRYENAGPYAFCGNQGTNFNTCTELGYGNHTVTATAIVNGVYGVTTTINFMIKNTTTSPILPPVQAPVPVPVPVKAPIPVPVPVPVPVTAPIPVPVPVPVPVQAPIPVPVPVPVPVPITAPTPVASHAITGLRLMYTGVDPSTYVQDLAFDVVNVIDLRLLSLPSDQFNIDVLYSAGIQSVFFSNGRTETAIPYAYCGNSGPNFYVCPDLKLDTNVTVTVYGHAEKYGAGPIVATKSTTIQIIRSLPPVAPIPIPMAPIAVPSPPTPVVVPPPIGPPVANCPVPKFVGNWAGAGSGATIPYPIQVAEAQGAMIGNDFIITSGFKSGYSMVTNETYALDMYTPGATWRRMDDMPFPAGLSHLGVAIKGMKGYFCGGYVGGGHGIQNGSCFEYDHSIPPGTGQQWSSIASIPDDGRSGGGLVYDTILDALIYSAGSKRPPGGGLNAKDFNNTWMYSFRNPSAGWVSKAPIPFFGNHMLFVTAHDDIGKEHHYMFGGQHGDNEQTGNTDEMYEYNAMTDTWIQRTNIPYPLGHAAASIRAIGCGFIVGGGRLNTGLTNDVIYYDIPTNTWTQIGELTHEIHTNVCVIANGIYRCETGWATGTFSWKRSITL